MLYDISGTLSRKTKIIVLMIIDICIIVTSYLFSFFITHIYYYNKLTFKPILKILPLITITYIAVLWILNMYKSIWSKAGVYEGVKSVIACLISGALILVVTSGFTSLIPRELNFIAGTFIVIFCTTTRFSIHLIKTFTTYAISLLSSGKENVLIIGAGVCSSILIDEIRREKANEYNIIGIIDDSVNKKNTYLNGIKILGNRNDILKIVEEKNIDLILFAISKIRNDEKKKIIDICQLTNARIKVIPGIYELLDKDISMRAMRDVNLKDLLGRDEVNLDKEGISEYIEGKTILVTGGGGSIGSELCRQIANYNPKLLLILDIYENNAYDLQNELTMKMPYLNKKVIIASVRDKGRLSQIFNSYKPDIVFHAAAHKHVPLMEDNPTEAIKNNVIGTLNVAKCASKYNAKKFVLISTDKAVNPTNVMGATKRLCEMIIQAIDKESRTEYVAVRFGNVLGSNGSVIPLFQRQIKEGGPVTLTHMNITRYFMLIPEAAQLVMQAGAYAKGGEIFVLDMGEPVRIYDLAKNLIRLSGLKLNKDIEIKVTGLRPGEKLYEELLMNNENLKKTSHKKIFIDKPEKFDLKELVSKIDGLVFVAKTEDRGKLVSTLKEIVPTYTSAEHYNKNNNANKEVALDYQ